jgi:hypothetical protein
MESIQLVQGMPQLNHLSLTDIPVILLLDGLHGLEVRFLVLWGDGRE